MAAQDPQNTSNKVSYGQIRQFIKSLPKPFRVEATSVRPSGLDAFTSEQQMRDAAERFGVKTGFETATITEQKPAIQQSLNPDLRILQATKMMRQINTDPNLKSVFDHLLLNHPHARLIPNKFQYLLYLMKSNVDPGKLNDPYLQELDKKADLEAQSGKSIVEQEAKKKEDINEDKKEDQEDKDKKEGRKFKLGGLETKKQVKVSEEKKEADIEVKEQLPATPAEQKTLQTETEKFKELGRAPSELIPANSILRQTLQHSTTTLPQTTQSIPVSAPKSSEWFGNRKNAADTNITYHGPDRTSTYRSVPGFNPSISSGLSIPSSGRVGPSSNPAMGDAGGPPPQEESSARGQRRSKRRRDPNLVQNFVKQGIKSYAKRFYWIAVFILVFLIIFIFVDKDNRATAPLPANACSNIAGGGGAGCPDQAALDANKGESCHYLNPSIDIFNTNISQQGIDKFKNTYRDRFVGKPLLADNGEIGTEQEWDRRINYIIQQSKKQGLNPAIAFGYWKSESAFSTHPPVNGHRIPDLGCDSSQTFDEQVNCIVGLSKDGSHLRTDPPTGPSCAASKDANSSQCQATKSVRVNGYAMSYYPDRKIYPDKTHPIGYPISTFDDFTEAQGPYDDLNENNQHGTCMHTYNTLIEMAELVGMCGTGGSNLAGSSNNVVTMASTKPLQKLAEVGNGVLGDQTFTIGNSAKGTPITGYQLGNGPQAVAIVGGMNGRTEQAGIDMVNVAYNAFKEGSTYKIPSNLTVYFIPEVTPDSSDGFNANGQDVNRNFDSSSVPGGAWNKLGCSAARYKSAGGPERWCGDPNGTSNIFSTYCSTISTGKHFYCAEKTGSSAFSESETQAVKNFISSKGIKAVLSYRAPYNNVTSSNSQQKLAGSESLAKNMGSWLGIEYQPYFRDYPVTGQFMDWLQDQKIVAVETELRISPNSDSSFRQTNMDAVQKALTEISGGINSSALAAQSGSACYCSLPKGGGGGAVSCPVAGGKILTNSFQADKVGGHCSPGYGQEGVCTLCEKTGYGGSRRAKAIDIYTTNNEDVTLPNIHGSSVTWEKIQEYTVACGDGGGNGYTFQAKLGNDKWTLDMLHMKSTSLQMHQTYPSGTVIGKTLQNGEPCVRTAHVHTTIGRNIANNTSEGDPVTDCDAGWLPSDFMCGGPDVTAQANASSSQNLAEASSNSNVLADQVTPSPADDVVSTIDKTNGSCSGAGGRLGNFVYYSQSDPNAPWSTHPYLCGSNIAYAGCGPTSLAMVLSTFGYTLTPDKVADVFTEKGWYVCSQGSAMTTALQDKSFLKNFGLQAGPSIITNSGGIDVTLAKKYLDAGSLIIASSDNWPVCSCGHIMVVDGIDPATGTLHVQDPIYSARDKHDYPAAANPPTWTFKYAIPIAPAINIGGVN